MSESANHATLEALVAALDASDLEALDRVFTDDVVLEWPQSGERIVGGGNRREIYSRFPALPRVTPRRMTGSDGLPVLEASLDYGDGDPFQCVFVSRCATGSSPKRRATGRSRSRPPTGGRPGSSGSGRGLSRELRPRGGGEVWSETNPKERT